MPTRPKKEKKQKKPAAESDSHRPQAVGSARTPSDSSETDRQPVSPKHGQRRWWKTALFSLLPLLVLFVAIEALLRIVNFGGSVALVTTVKCDDGTRLYMLNPESRKRFFFRQPRNLKTVGDATYRETFAYQKPSDTKRVVVVGESAVLGYPYGRNVSFAAYLQSILERRYPATRFEVINAGITAVSSYVVLDNVRELVHYSPDLIVVYCGHNEFYGTYAPTSEIGSWRWRPAVLAFMRFQRTKTYLALKSLVGRRPMAAAEGAEGTSRAALIGSMPRDEHIRLDSPVHRTAELNFRRNLEAMVAATRRHNVPLILCTLASNQRDCAPLRNQHRPDMTEEELRLWQEQFNGGRQAVADGATSPAIEKLSQCTRLDPEHADAHFLLGRAWEKTGDREKAAQAYGAALDNDGMHFRACSRFNAIVRDLAAQVSQQNTRVALADIAAVIRDHSPDHLIGLDLVIDHVHLRARGICLAAAEMARIAEANDLLHLGKPPSPAMPTFEQCNEDTAYSNLDELMVTHAMIRLFGDYPFDQMINRQEVIEKLTSSTKALENALDPIARAVYQGRRDDLALLLHNRAANAYFQAGQYADSTREVRALLRQSEDYDAMTVGFLFHIYMCYLNRKDLDEKQKQQAMDGVFAQARDLFAKFHSRPRENPWLQYLFMGKFYFVRNRFADAIPLLRKTIAMAPKERDAYEFLIQSCVRAERPEGVEDLARRLREIDPGNALAATILKGPAPQ